MEEDEVIRLRITDFGISLIEQVYTNSASYTAKGASRWMAPEILLPPEGQPESGRPTEKSDVYAYAMTCMEVSCQPFLPLNIINLSKPI